MPEKHEMSIKIFNEVSNKFNFHAYKYIIEYLSHWYKQNYENLNSYDLYIIYEFKYRNL